MSINLIGFLGYAALVMCGVGCVLYAIKWLLGRVSRGRDIY
jgi:hypothetical protein